MTVFKKQRQLFKRSFVSNEQLARGISKVLIKIREIFVAFFDRTYNKLSPSRQKFSLILFCLLTGGLSLYQILKAVNKDDNAPVDGVSTKIAPRHFQEIGDNVKVESTIVTEAEYKRVTAFETYMDSLKKSKNGYLIYDSILQSRPGLMDSVEELRNLYESQLIKKK